MFDQKVQFKTGNRWVSFPAAVVILTVALLALLLFPAKAAVRMVKSKEPIYVSLAPKQPPKPKVAERREPKHDGGARSPEQNPAPKPAKPFEAPRTIPKEVAIIKDDEKLVSEIARNNQTPPGNQVVPGCTPPFCGTGSDPNVRIAPPPDPPAAKPEPKPEPPKRIAVSTGVQHAKLQKVIRPLYPPLARAGRVQGTVRLHAIISRDGRIENLQLVSGNPLLVPAAVEAVKQWVYEPTLLNGVPVEVVTQIDVNFTLSN